MAIILPPSPAENTVIEVSAQRKLVFTEGRWKLFTNNVPWSKDLLDDDHPAVVSEDQPNELISPEILWYKPSTDTLYFKKQDGPDVFWMPVPQQPPIISEAEPATTVKTTLWLKPSTGVIYFLYKDNEIIEWRPFPVKAAAVIITDPEPAMDVIGDYWFRPLDGAFFFKRDIDGMLGWQQINTPGAATVDEAAITAAATEAATLAATQAATQAAQTAAAAAASAAVVENVFDVNGKISADKLYSYVDDVVEYSSVAEMQAQAGEKGKIYVVVHPDESWDQYRWTGTVYFMLPRSPGSTDDVPEGLLNKYFSAQRARDAVTDISGNAGTADKLKTARKIKLTGDVSGEAMFTGEADVEIAVTVSGGTGGGSSGPTPYDPSGSIFGVPADGEAVIHTYAVRAYTLTKDQPGAQAHAEIAPAANASLTIYKDTTAVGTIAFTAGNPVGQVSMPAEVSMVAGNLLSVRCPVVADASMSGVHVTLVGASA